jgi:hypothetical protein
VTLPSWLTWPPSIPEWLLPWHVALGIALLCLLGFLVARIQLERAREDWANAFFYSPSSKTKQRQRRQRWQDRMWALFFMCVTALLAAGFLYLQSRAA